MLIFPFLFLLGYPLKPSEDSNKLHEKRKESEKKVTPTRPEREERKKREKIISPPPAQKETPRPSPKIAKPVEEEKDIQVKYNKLLNKITMSKHFFFLCFFFSF